MACCFVFLLTFCFGLFCFCFIYFSVLFFVMDFFSVGNANVIFRQCPSPRNSEVMSPSKVMSALGLVLVLC